MVIKALEQEVERLKMLKRRCYKADGGGIK